MILNAELYEVDISSPSTESSVLFIAAPSSVGIDPLLLLASRVELKPIPPAPSSLLKKPWASKTTADRCLGHAKY